MTPVENLVDALIHDARETANKIIQEAKKSTQDALEEQRKKGRERAQDIVKTINDKTQNDALVIELREKSAAESQAKLLIQDKKNAMIDEILNQVKDKLSTWTKTKEINHPGFSMLHGCDITADDRYVYVSSRNTNDLFKPYFDVENEGPPGTIGIIDTQTDEVVKLIEIEQFGSGLVVEK